MIRIPPYGRRRRLAGEARAYIAAGWPVATGAWWDADDGRYRCAEPDCHTEGLHPTVPGNTGMAIRGCRATVTQAATHDLGAVAGRWDTRPYSVLLPTGQACDVVELRPGIARRVQARLAAAGRLGPVASYPDDRTLLFTRVAGELDPDLEAELACAGALHHGRGSWVPLPPTELACGPIRWSRSPGVASWRLPPLRTVIDAVRVALSMAPPASPTPLAEGS